MEADIQAYFDSIDRKMLQEMIRTRVADGALRRLIGKCLHVGVLDGEEYSEPDEGTVQGSVLSPLLGNVYLHYVLDEWFERDVRPRLRGKAHLVRYAGDFVIGFDTHYWRRSRRGQWVPSLKTRTARLRRAITAVADWCRRHRHLSVKEQHASLKRRLVGHHNYFGANDNWRSLAVLQYWAMRAWHKWLCRRSQRAHLTARLRRNQSPLCPAGGSFRGGLVDASRAALCQRPARLRRASRGGSKLPRAPPERHSSPENPDLLT